MFALSKETMNDIKNAIEPCSGSHLDRIFVVMDIVCIVDTGNRLVETQSQGYIFCLYFYLIISFYSLTTESINYDICIREVICMFYLG